MRDGGAGGIYKRRKREKEITKKREEGDQKEV
jgi:hypothetical protein